MYLSSETNDTLLKSINIAKESGDEYVSIDYILLAIFESKGTASSILKDNGITQKELKEVIRQTRNGKKVDSPNMEQNYDSLNRYARNLNELAEKGMLDPVIGRDEEIRRVLQILSRRTKTILY